MAGGEHSAGGEEQVARLDILTGTTDMVALRDGQVDEHRAGRLVEGGLLDHDHGVGTVGHRRTRHDAGGLARTDVALECRTGGNRTDDLQGHRHRNNVGGPNGETVHSRIRERGNLLGRNHIGGEHETGGIGKRHACRRKTGDTIEDVLTGFVEGDHPVRLEAVRLQSSTQHGGDVGAIITS